jgi:3-hydroxyacyl-[acyl-carrier-protein] dehydratase
MRLEYFQLIDRIVDLRPAERTIAVEATVPTESTIFEGHFPGHPLMPGVLLAEAMAQTSGWLIIALNRFERMPFLAAMKELKLRSFVQPGQQIALDATLVHDGSGFAMTRARGRVEGKLVCDATITFRVVEFPNSEMRGHMHALAKVLEFPMGALADG